MIIVMKQNGKTTLRGNTEIAMSKHASKRNE